jgi:hypothetical protein
MTQGPDKIVPSTRRPVSATQEAQSGTKVAAPRIRADVWATNIGMAIMATAFLWWAVFYAQWTGPLRMLDLKVPCLVHTIDECSYFQSNLSSFHAVGPAYQPIVMWIGTATFIAGRFLKRGTKQGARQ